MNICWEGSRNYQHVTQSSGTRAFVSACSCKLVMELRVQYSPVQMNGETQIYSMQLVQMRLNLYKWGVEHSTFVFTSCKTVLWSTPHLHSSRWSSQAVKWGVEHSTIFICFIACVKDVKLVQMRGGTVQLCNLY